MFGLDKDALPPWLTDRLAAEAGSFRSPQARMQLVIELARLNVRHGSGGPFAAAIFDMDDGRLLAAGVNRVVPLNSSIAHAEMLAIAAAQHKLGCFDLAAKGMPRCELVASCEPCAMCFGALPWSGIRRLVCGARFTDAERIGFDEGPRHPDWVEELARRGIEVVCDVCRKEAIGVFDAYLDAAGPIYNSSRNIAP
jgi:tRNA(Arg) A34 adenosine deaminase TadA